MKKHEYREHLDTAAAHIDQQQHQIAELRREVESLRGALARERAAHTSLAASRALRRKAPVEWGEERVLVSRPTPPAPGVVVASTSWSLEPAKALEIFLVWANGTDLPMSTNPAHLAAWLEAHS